MGNLSFPTPYDDEFLGGVVLRYHQLYGSRNLRETLRETLKIGRGVLTGFPYGLSEFIQRIPRLWLSVDDILNRHTAWNLYSPFVIGDARRRILNEMYAGSSSSYQLRLGDATSRLHLHRNLWLCYDCVHRDVEQYGQYYFHVDHHLPGVIACPFHGASLTETQLNRTRTWDLNVIVPSKRNVANEREVKLSQLIANFRSQRLDPFNGQFLSDIYQERLRALELLGPHGYVRHKELYKMLVSFHSMTLMNRLHASSNNIQHWVHSILYKPYQTHHPLKHLLLIGAIFGSVQSFIEACIQGDLNTNKSAPTLKRDIESLIVNYFNERKGTLSDAAKQMRISITTCAVYAQKHGVQFSSRRKLIDQRLKKSIVAKLCRGNPVKAVAMECGVSIPTVGRILRASPSTKQRWLGVQQDVARSNRRTEWMQIAKKHPGSSITELRQISQRTYAWLYRHDRAWLLSSHES